MSLVEEEFDSNIACCLLMPSSGSSKLNIVVSLQTLMDHAIKLSDDSDLSQESRQVKIEV
eukprot:763764-Hanusia_phi.AAC.4